MVSPKDIYRSRHTQVKNSLNSLGGSMFADQAETLFYSYRWILKIHSTNFVSNSRVYTGKVHPIYYCFADF